MARGKIVSDPEIWINKQIKKYTADYNGAWTTVQRDHLSDKLAMLEKLKYGLSCYQELMTYRSLFFAFEQKYGITVGSFLNKVRREDLHGKI